MTVYITQNPMRRNGEGELVHTYDLTPAREYGNLEVLLPSGPVRIDPAPAVRQLRQKLANFTLGDYLLCLGDPVVIGAASAIVANMNNGVVPLLVWDRHVRKYLSITLDTFGRIESPLTPAAPTPFVQRDPSEPKKRLDQPDPLVTGADFMGRRGGRVAA